MVYKKIFKVFPDDRGYLNPIDLEYLLNAINKPNFSLSYQLISSSKKKCLLEDFIIKGLLMSKNLNCASG